MSQEKEQPKPRKAPLSFWFALFMLFVTGIVFLPTSIVLGICLLPAVVAGIIDRHPKKTAWLTVGALNFAGTVPSCISLWDSSHTLETALQLITQPVTLLMAYGGAAVGWFLQYNIPPFVAAYLFRRAENRVKDIERQQKELQRKWGDSVIS